MSIQNEKTIKVYSKKAKQYLINNSKIDPIAVKKYNNKIHRLIKKWFGLLPEGSKVFEVGSADGINALYIQKIGLDITASDIADDFINEIKKKNLNVVKFNILKDKFIEKYSAFFCWKVFVHFTPDDVLMALENIYYALENSGILIFNLISNETKSVKEEWIDFPNEYSIGMERFFKYYSKSEMDSIIERTKFKIIDYHQEVGIEKIKWLIYVLKKEDDSIEY